MNFGFVVLWRKFQETSFYKDSYAVHLALHLIMRANHEDKKIIFNKKELIIHRGQTVAGRYTLAYETGINPNTIKDKIDLLATVGFLTKNPTNKFTILTICKYSDYQDKKNKSHQPDTSQTPARHQPDTTNNNDNNDNNDNNVTKSTEQAPDFLKLPDNPEVKATIDYLQKQGLTLDLVIQRARRKLGQPKGWLFPDQVILNICAAYQREKDRIHEPWPWFQTVLIQEYKAWHADNHERESAMAPKRAPAAKCIKGIMQGIAG
jgi:hypothetical protein